MLVKVLEVEENLATRGEWLLCYYFQKTRALVLSFVAEFFCLLVCFFVQVGVDIQGRYPKTSWYSSTQFLYSPEFECAVIKTLLSVCCYCTWRILRDHKWKQYRCEGVQKALSVSVPSLSLLHLGNIRKRYCFLIGTHICLFLVENRLRGLQLYSDRKLPQ